MHWFKYVPSYGQYNGSDYKGRQVYNLDGGDGGGSPPPQPTQTSQLTIPEYAKPYMENLLGRTEALTTAPYQTYGGERLTQLDPLQTQAYQNVYQMQTPGQFDFATGLAGAGGLSALQAGQYQPGQFMAPLTQTEQLQQYQAAGPSAIGSGMGSFAGEGVAEQYMSPYMQNVLDVQKAAAIRDAQKAQLAGNLGAARQGTYGGARQLLATTERERALGGQLAEIQAKGLQSAYEQAQRAFEQEQARGLQAGLQTQQLGTQTGLANLQSLLQTQQLGTQTGMQSQIANQQALLDAQRLAEQSRQFGGTLGLQGAQAATQAATTLGQLGATEAATGLDIAKAQEQFGAAQRQAQQQALDLQYQDFLAQQQYPYLQLGFMSDILRGGASLAATGGKAIYQAPPSQTQNMMQLGLGALGLYGATK